MSMSLDTTEYNRAIEQLARASGGRYVGTKILKPEAKLFVKDTAKRTPPIADNTKESFAAQKRKGEAVVARDINRVFVAVEDLKVIKRSKNDQLREDLKKALRGRSKKRVEAMLDRIGFQDPDLLRKVDPILHERARNKKGRVPKAFSNRHIVMSKASIKKYVKKVQKRVGKFKSGWTRAANGLGLRLPKWITRHVGQQGVFIDHSDSANKPSITVGNLASGYEFVGARKLMIAALKERTRSMRVRAEKAFNRRFRRHSR